MSKIIIVLSMFILSSACAPMMGEGMHGHHCKQMEKDCPCNKMNEHNMKKGSSCPMCAKKM